MAELETIGIAFDPRPAQAGADAAAAGARNMARSIAESLRLIDDSARRIAVSLTALSEVLHTRTAAMGRATDTFSQRWTIVGQTVPRSMVLIGRAAQAAASQTTSALSAMGNSAANLSRFQALSTTVRSFDRLGAAATRSEQSTRRSTTAMADAIQRAAQSTGRSTEQMVRQGENLRRGWAAAGERVQGAVQRMVQGVASSLRLSDSATQRMVDGAMRGTQQAGGAFMRLQGVAGVALQGMVQSAQRARMGVALSMEGIQRAAQRAGAAIQQAGSRFHGMGGRVQATTGVIGRGVGQAIASLVRLTSAFTIIGAQASRMATGVTQGVGAVTRLSRAFSGLSGAAGGGVGGIVALTAGIGALVFVTGAVTAALVGLVAGIGALVIAAKTASFAMQTLREAMNLAGPVQQSILSFQAMTGQLKEAERVMDALRAKSRATGADLEGSMSTTKRFMALNFSPDDAMKLNSNILDVAGAMGLTTVEAKLLGTALAQVQAKGVVSMEELRQQIAEKGIPVFEELSRKTGLWGKDLTDAVANAEVPASALIDIFLNMEGGFARFAGGAERMTKTLPGAIARLKANWQDLLITMGLPINEAIAPILNDISDRLEEMQGTAFAIGKSLGDGIKLAYEVIKAGDGMEGLRLAFAAATEFLGNAANSALMIAFHKAAQYAIELFAAAIETTVSLLADLLTWAIESVSELIRVTLGGAYRDTTQDYRDGGVTATEYLGVVIKNTLGQAFEDVVNAFADGLKKVIEAAAKGLGQLSDAINPASGVIEKLTGKKPGEAMGDLAAYGLDWIPRINTHEDIALPQTRADMLPSAPGEREAIAEMTRAAQAVAAALAGNPAAAGMMLSADPIAALENSPVTLTDLFKMDFGARPTTAQDALKDFLGNYSIPETEKVPDSEYTAPPRPEESVEPLIQKARKVKEESPTDQMISEVGKLMMEWSNFEAQLDKVAAGTMVSVANNMTDAIASIIEGTKDAKTAFSDMATSIISDIMRMVTQMLIQLAIARLLQAAGVPVPVANQVAGAASSQPFRSDAWLPAGGSSYTPNPNWNGGQTAAASSTTAESSYHTGGVVQFRVPSYHTGGVSSGEAMAKVEKGETILTRRRAAELEDELRSRRGEGKKEKKSSESRATIINVFDKNEIADIVASNPDAVMNAISRRLPAIRKMVIGGQRL